MTRVRIIALPAAAFVLVAGAPAATPPAQPDNAKPVRLSEVICEKQQATGSRLVTKRVCKTRSQWAEDRLQDRQDLEKVQVQRSIR